MIYQRVLAEFLPEWPGKQSFPDWTRDLADLRRKVRGYSALESFDGMDIAALISINIRKQARFPGRRSWRCGLDFLHGKVIERPIGQQLPFPDPEIVFRWIPVAGQCSQWRKLLQNGRISHIIKPKLQQAIAPKICVVKIPVIIRELLVIGARDRLV